MNAPRTPDREDAAQRHPLPWTWEEHELSEGYSCIIYDARGQRVGGFDYLDRYTAALIVQAVNARDAMRLGTLPDCMMPDGAEPCLGYQRERQVRDDLVAALQGVLRVADRKTVEFDAARAAIAKAEGRQP